MAYLETERTILRPFEPDDAAQAHRLFSDEEAMRLVGMYPPYTTMEQTEGRITRWMADREEKRYAIIEKDTGRFIGYIAVDPDSEEEREDTRELGFAVCSDCRKKGYMKEVVSAVLPALKGEGIRYVWACCFKGNAASEGLIRSLDFQLQQEGTYDAPNDRTYESLEFMISL